MVINIRLILEIIGGITAIISLIGLFYVIICWFLGITPLLRRLGLGRWFRKVYIAAQGDSYENLSSDLIDSGVFREKNINQITSESIAKIKDSDLILLDYNSFKEDEIKKIISNKKSKAGLVVYFPIKTGSGRIGDEIMELINNEPHTVLVNFRGRLINDLLVTLLCTSYDKK